jgi:hypothetical protein
VIGQTAEAQMRKGRPEGRRWDERSFLDELERQRGAEEAQVSRQIMEWSRTHLPRFTFGKGALNGSFAPVLDYGGHNYWPFIIWTNKGIEIQFQHMKGRPPFDEEPKKLELLRRLNEIPGVQIPKDAIERRPNLPLGLFATQETLATLLAAFEWFLSEARLAASAASG